MALTHRTRTWIMATGLTLIPGLVSVAAAAPQTPTVAPTGVVYCPAIAGFDTTSEHRRYELGADLLSKIVSSVLGVASTEKEVDPILHRFPNADQLLPALVYYASQCRLIIDDPQLPLAEKRAQLRVLYLEVFRKESSPGAVKPAATRTEFRLGDFKSLRPVELYDVRVTILKPGTKDAQLSLFIGTLRPTCTPFGVDGRERAVLFMTVNFEGQNQERTYLVRPFGQTPNNHFAETTLGPVIGTDQPVSFKFSEAGRCG